MLNLRPTHFLSLPLETVDCVYLSIEAVQSKIAADFPEFSLMRIPPCRLHISLALLHIPIARELEAVRHMKKELQALCHRTGKLSFPIQGLWAFPGDRVLYTRPSGGTRRLFEVKRCIDEVLDAQHIAETCSNIKFKGKRWQPHITVAKVKQIGLNQKLRLFDADIGNNANVPASICNEWYAKYREISFGRVMFDRVDLCAMRPQFNDARYAVVESFRLGET